MFLKSVLIPLCLLHNVFSGPATTIDWESRKSIWYKQACQRNLHKRVECGQNVQDEVLCYQKNCCWSTDAE
jgi:hypothetical protein